MVSAGCLPSSCKPARLNQPTTHQWQAKRCGYSNEFRKRLKDVVLSPIGKNIVAGMFKQAKAKIEPKEEAEPLNAESMLLKLNNIQDRLVKQEMQNMRLKQENEEKGQTIEAQKQEIEELRMAVVMMQATGTGNLSDMKDGLLLSGLGSLSDLGEPDLSAWPSPTPSVKSEGAETYAYGA